MRKEIFFALDEADGLKMGDALRSRERRLQYGRIHTWRNLSLRFLGTYFFYISDGIAL